MDETTDFPRELTEDNNEISVEERISLSKRIMGMAVTEKIRLALLGNREARNILIKDSNKLVTTAVLKSPKITEPEILEIVQSRSVDDELLKIIARNREWIKSYRIRYNMVNNPKTPIQIALRFLPRLNAKDIKNISKNKNIPSIITTTAKYILQNKKR